MFYQYEVVNNGNEEVLYLYINLKYEFSNELSFNNNYDLGRRCRNFIYTNKINFTGNKVYLIVDNIIVKVLDIRNIPLDIINDNKYSCDNFMINIKLEDNSMCEISLRECLLSLLFNMYDYNLNDEVLKAICILYNTYLYKNKCINYNDSFISYKELSYYRDNINYNNIINKLNNIISSVNGMFLSYNDDYILPFIHYSNSGKTLTDSKYPYLSSVKSLWDLASPLYIDINDFSYSDLNNKYNINIDSNSRINVNNKRIYINNNIYTLEEFRDMLNLKSTDMYFIINNNYLRVITKGCGNFYGLSIYGANEIALNGGMFSNILKYYFPKTKLLKYIKKELS